MIPVTTVLVGGKEDEMAQFQYSGNLNAANFPFSASFKGRSVIRPGSDQNPGPFRYFGGRTVDQGSNIPQCYYAENITPTEQGYKSVGYQSFLPAPNPAATGRFIKEFTVYDGLGNKGLIGITTDSKIYMLTTFGLGVWDEVAPSVGTWAGTDASTATVFGTIYLHLEGLGVYEVDITDNTITKVTVTGVTDSATLGIASSTSYMIMWDQTTIYWSSTTDPLDFVPSLITGAGQGEPDDLQGQIVFVKNIDKGYIIYSTVVILVGLYTGNGQYPWIFNSLVNGSGISSRYSVTEDNSLTAHYAWASAGLTVVTAQKCELVHPELTDFLAGKVWDTFSTETKVVTTEYLGSPVQVRLAFIASRYLCVSYGRTDETTYGVASEMEYAVILDTVMERWGKLKCSHVQLFEITVDTNRDGITYIETDPETYLDYPVPYFSLVNWTNSVAQAKNYLGVLNADGTITYVDFSYTDASAPGVLILGKFQITRANLQTLQQADLECVDQGNENFSLNVQCTLNGRNTVIPVVAPVEVENLPEFRRFNSRATGMNQSLVVEGAFNLVSYILTFSPAGRPR